MLDLRNFIDIIQTLYEAKTAPLYHTTGFAAAELILKRKNIEASDNSMDRDEFHDISTTRDPCLRYYQVEGQDMFGHAPIQFVLNQETITHRHKLTPANYQVHDEQEEKIITNKLPISHVTAIQLFTVPKDYMIFDFAL